MENKDFSKPKTIITKRPDGSKRVQVLFTDISLTDQSSKKACDINNILKQYSKQGITPQIITDPKYYRDNSSTLDFNDAFNVVNRAMDEFNSLHPDLRKLMDNDPSNLESFIQNPDNYDMLIKHKVIVQRQPKAPEQPKTPEKQDKDKKD